MAIKKLVTLPKVSGRLQTKLVTTKVMYYFRYTRQCMLTASEVGTYSSDVLAINKNSFVTEIEVKVSYQDFLKEFKKEYKFYRKSSKKHEIYANAESPWVPNYYYFAVPEELEQKVKSFLEKRNSKYGVIRVSNGPIQNGFNIVQCQVTRTAKRLHSNPCSEKVKAAVLNRMSSEVIQRRINLCRILYEREVDQD